MADFFMGQKQGKNQKGPSYGMETPENMLRQCITVLVIIAFFLTILDAEQISKIMGT
jgi:hypothetical protein